jgi:TRAP-type uncharacterized transport system substrate-binding protein
MVRRWIAPTWEATAGRWVALTSALIVLLVAAAVASLYFSRLPPHTIVIAAGPKNGAYYKFGKKYAEALERSHARCFV